MVNGKANMAAHAHPMSKKLKKAKVKNCFKGSKVKTVKVKVSSSTSTNKKFKSTYKKYFKKANSGKSVTIK